MKEIERKYLLNRSILEFLDKTSTAYKKITQFYIKATSHKSLRFRKYGSQYYKCIKLGTGGIREENEEEVSQKVYKKNLKKCIGRSIKKIRYLFKLDRYEYSVDVYKKQLENLYVMEVEFESIAAYENFVLPSTLKRYVEKEVTDDEAYKNKNLALFGLPYEESDATEKGSAHVLMQVFEKLLSDIYLYREKILTDGDDEDLHQLRIACRRSVVLMGEFRLLYEEESLLEHRAGLKNLINISNTKRDMDVLISELTKIEGEREVYLLESFGYLYEKKEIKKLLKEMKKLQNVLGLFHDSHQQKMIFEGLVETEENERVQVCIKEILLSGLKAYQKKEILEIQKLLNRFLKKEKAYRQIFA